MVPSQYTPSTFVHPPFKIQQTYLEHCYSHVVAHQHMQLKFHSELQLESVFANFIGKEIPFFLGRVPSNLSYFLFYLLNDL